MNVKAEKTALTFDYLRNVSKKQKRREEIGWERGICNQHYL